MLENDIRFRKAVELVKAEARPIARNCRKPMQMKPTKRRRKQAKTPDPHEDLQVCENPVGGGAGAGDRVFLRKQGTDVTESSL